MWFNVIHTQKTVELAFGEDDKKLCYAGDNSSRK